LCVDRRGRRARCGHCHGHAVSYAGRWALGPLGGEGGSGFGAHPATNSVGTAVLSQG
jgi:hypothetical protein